MLFKLNKDNTAVLHQECYQLCPALKNLNSKQILYIILTYDYDSPYRLLPLEERRRTAKAQVYGTSDVKPENDKIILVGIKIFMSLQYDPKRESIETYSKKIQLLENDLLTSSGASEITGIIKSIEHLTKASDNMQKDIDRDESLEELEGGGKLSLLEKMQNNGKLYKLHRDVISTPNKA